MLLNTSSSLSKDHQIAVGFLYLSLGKLLTPLFIKVVTLFLAVLNNAMSLQAPAVLIRCSGRGTLHTTSQTSISQDSLYVAELHFAVGDLPEMHIFGGSFGKSNHTGFKTFNIYNKPLVAPRFTHTLIWRKNNQNIVCPPWAIINYTECRHSNTFETGSCPILEIIAYNQTTGIRNFWHSE